MRYFVGTELGVANVLRRHFDWTSNSLFYEEVRAITFFSLSVNSSLHRYLMLETHRKHSMSLVAKTT